MKRKFQKKVGLLLVLMLLLSMMIPPVYAVNLADITSNQGIARNQDSPREYAPNQLLIKFNPKMNGKNQEVIKKTFGLKTIKRHSLIESELVSVNSHIPLEDILAKLKNNPNIIYAEPNYKLDKLQVNDPLFNSLWGLHNTGQNIIGDFGVPDVDIDAPEAWNYTKGSGEIIVAVIDEGIDINHPDLEANIWTNPYEIAGDGIDNDGNGFIDDVNGWDFYHDDKSVYDATDGDQHGTHVAGTIAALANNGIGVTGVAPQVKIMPIKFLGPSGGYTSDAISAIEYAKRMGANITSNSWGGGSFSTALYDAIANFGGVFVAAAGNNGSNTDYNPHYPSSYDLPNIISVAAVDNRGDLAYFSNYGRNSVDLGAPGVDILSLAPGSNYQYMSGTSMATPHVSGISALMLSVNPKLTAIELKDLLLVSSVPMTSLQGKTLSGGLSNANEALIAVVGNGPFVTNTSPVNGAINVPGDQAIVATFNENIYPGDSFNQITLTSNGVIIPAGFSITDNNLIISPESILQTDSEFTVYLPIGAVKNLNEVMMRNNYTFSFKTVDTKSPSILITDPFDGEINVPVDKTITIQFDENIRPGINIDNITVGGVPINSTGFHWGIDGNVLYITNYNDLAYDTFYEVNIPSGAVTDEIKNPLEAPYIFSFTTMPDTIAPEVYSTDPEHGMTNVSVSKVITITFSENIQSSLNISNISLTTRDLSVPITLNIEGDSLKITPQEKLQVGTTYYVNLPENAVSDMAGNGLVNPVNFNFVTGPFDVLELPFPVDEAVIDPDNPIIYMINYFDPKLYSFNYQTGEIEEVSITYIPQSLELGIGQFADEIYVAMLNQEPVPYENKTNQGNIAVIDRFSFTLKNIISIETDPFDLVAGRDGYLYMAPGSGQWAQFESYDRISMMLKDSSGIRHMSYGKLHPFLDRIYTIDTDLSPRDFTAYNIANGAFTDPSYPGGYDSPYHGDYALTTNFKIDPTGRYIFNGSGNIFTTDADVTKDMLYVGTLGTAFNDAAFGEGLSNIYTLPSNSNAINIYDGGNFSQTGTLELADRGKFIFRQGQKLVTILDGYQPTYSYQTGLQVIDIPDTYPVITSTNPVDASIDVPIQQRIIVSFSENMFIGNGYDNITLTETSSGTVVPINKSLTDVITITPLEALTYSTNYMVTIPADAVQDGAGNPLANQTTFSFTTEKEPDTVAPVINTTSPIDGASDVPINQGIVITFSEEIFGGNNYQNISLKDVTGRTLSIDKSISGQSLTITPLEALTYSTNYIVTILEDAVQDGAGNPLANQTTFSFTTEKEPDTVAPVISTTSPIDGASDVPINQGIVITFSEEIFSGNNYQNISLADVTGRTLSIDKSISGQSLTITPLEALTYSTNYIVTIPEDAVQDGVGNSLANQTTFSFTTENALDINLPTIIGTLPVDGEIEVNINTTITITFSENIQLGAQSGMITIMKGKKEEAFTLEVNGNELIIRPNHLVTKSTYVVTLPSGSVKDLSGNSLENSYTFSFTTSKR